MKGLNETLSIVLYNRLNVKTISMAMSDGHVRWPLDAEDGLARELDAIRRYVMYCQDKALKYLKMGSDHVHSGSNEYEWLVGKAESSKWLPAERDEGLEDYALDTLNGLSVRNKLQVVALWRTIRRTRTKGGS